MAISNTEFYNQFISDIAKVINETYGDRLRTYTTSAGL